MTSQLNTRIKSGSRQVPSVFWGNRPNSRQMLWSKRHAAQFMQCMTAAQVRCHFSACSCSCVPQQDRVWAVCGEAHKKWTLSKQNCVLYGSYWRWTTTNWPAQLLKTCVLRKAALPYRITIAPSFFRVKISPHYGRPSPTHFFGVLLSKNITGFWRKCHSYARKSPYDAIHYNVIPHSTNSTEQTLWRN